MHIIAADVGGTKTRLAFAESENPYHVIYEAQYQSQQFDDFESLLQTFINDSGAIDVAVSSLSLAFPGLVNEKSAQLTNLSWTIDKQHLNSLFEIENIVFMNDFQASALGINHLQKQDFIILNSGNSSSVMSQNKKTQVVVGAGTGLGVAWSDIEIHSDRHTISSHDTEGGHIDFAVDQK